MSKADHFWFSIYASNTDYALAAVALSCVVCAAAFLTKAWELPSHYKTAHHGNAPYSYSHKSISCHRS